MAAPTLVDYAESAYTGTGTTETTDNLAWNSGDRAVALGATEVNSTTISTPTVTGLTFSAMSGTPTNTASSCKAYGWTAAAAGASGNGAVTATVNAAQGAGISVWTFSNVDSIQAPVVNVGTGATVNMTVVADSTVLMILADFDATADVTVTTTPAGGTIREATNNSGRFTVLVIEWANQAAGTRAYGVTAWTGTGTISKVAAEVRGAAGGAIVDVAGDLALTATMAGTQDHDIGVAGDRAATATIIGAQAHEIGVAGDRGATATIAGTALRAAEVAGDRAATATVAGALLREAAVSGTQAVTAARTGPIAIDSMHSGSRASTAALAGVAAVDRTVAADRAVSVALAGAIDIQGRVDIDGARPVAAALAGTAQRLANATAATQFAATMLGVIDVVAPVRVDGDRATIATVAGVLAASKATSGAVAVGATITGAVAVAAAFTPAPSPVEGASTIGPRVEARTALTPVEGSTVLGRGVE